MKVTINSKIHELPLGAKLAEVVQIIREEDQDDPVTRSLIETTGEDHLTFILNKRIIRPRDFEKTPLKEGDEIRCMHPYAGG
jgi:sulfur carrier protein ThiS